MFFTQLLSNFLLFVLSLLGLLQNRRNILIILMSIETFLLSLNLNFVVSSTYLDDLSGQIFSFFILTVAASESGVGLAIIILYYKLRGNISMFKPITLKG